MLTRPTLIILPGWGGTKESWQKFIDLARSNYEAVCLELPCFGGEPCPPQVWGVEEYANFVKNKLSGFSPPNTVILGHSFGGQVAACLIGANPHLCAKLILSGAAVYRRQISLKQLIFWPLAKVGGRLFCLPGLRRLSSAARRVLYLAADSPDYSKTSGIEREIFKRITKQDVSGYLPGITVPTLVVWGQKDAYVPLSAGRRIARCIPGARLEVVPGGRHGLHIQKPQELLEIIKSFTP